MFVHILHSQHSLKQFYYLFFHILLLNFEIQSNQTLFKKKKKRELEALTFLEHIFQLLLAVSAQVLVLGTCKIFLVILIEGIGGKKKVSRSRKG